MKFQILIFVNKFLFTESKAFVLSALTVATFLADRVRRLSPVLASTVAKNDDENSNLELSVNKLTDVFNMECANKGTRFVPIFFIAKNSLEKFFEQKPLVNFWRPSSPTRNGLNCSKILNCLKSGSCTSRVFTHTTPSLKSSSNNSLKSSLPNLYNYL